MKKTSILILIAAFLMAAVLLCSEAGLFAAVFPRFTPDTSRPAGSSDPGSVRTESPETDPPLPPTERTDPVTTRTPETGTSPVTSGGNAEVTSSAELSSRPEESSAVTSSGEITDVPGTTGPETAENPESTQSPESTRTPGTSQLPDTLPQPPVTTVPETEPPVPKPVVGISSADGYSLPASYAAAARNAGFDVRMLPFVITSAQAAQQLKTVDAVIMTGGEDIDPAYYGEEVLSGANVEIFPVRDTSDCLYIQAALDADLPMLCICRGMQILNVVRGGTLTQDIPLQVPSSAVVHRDPNRYMFMTHAVTTEPDSVVRTVLGTSRTVNSWHHQAVSSTGIHVRVTAYAPDGVAEAIELTDKPYVIGLQFHPEEYAKNGNQTFLKFFTLLQDYIPTKKEGN